MEEKVVDRRVRKTKRQLRLALMKLMAEKSVKDISVRELAAIADINRGTFYIHYKDVYDLLSSLEDELADGLTVVCRRHNAKDSEGKTYPYLMELYQFIQPQQLANIEAMYPDAVATAYQSALAYVQSYIGAMFDITAMLDSEDTSSTALTLRLALAICTATYILSSSPQFSEVIELQNKQLHTLLRGLKSGNRNFGKAAIAGEPNVRVQVVKLERTGAKP